MIRNRGEISLQFFNLNFKLFGRTKDLIEKSNCRKFKKSSKAQFKITLQKQAILKERLRKTKDAEKRLEREKKRLDMEQEKSQKKIRELNNIIQNKETA